jgi:hypothetical protein
MQNRVDPDAYTPADVVAGLRSLIQGAANT